MRCYLDRRFPSKIFGLRLNGMVTGEWFGSGMGGHGDTDLIGDNSNATQQEWGAAPPSAGLRDAPTIGKTLVAGPGPVGVAAFNCRFAKRTIRAFAMLAQAAKATLGWQNLYGILLRVPFRARRKSPHRQRPSSDQRAGARAGHRRRPFSVPLRA